MKSYVNFLQGLYASIISQIEEDYPSLHADSSRDLSRLFSLVSSRGLSFLMIDLPDMGKHFDMCMSQGRLTPSKLAGQRPFKKGRSVPRLFKGLILRVFDEYGLLRIDPDIQAYRYLRQLYYGAKKVKVSCEESRTWEHVHDFFSIDRKVRSPTLCWDDDDFDVRLLQDVHLGDRPRSDIAPLFGYTDSQYPDVEESLSSFDYGCADAIQRTADAISASIGRFDPTEWRAKHGPGAVADSYHTFYKYDFPNWPTKLEMVFPMSELGFPNYDGWIDHITSDGDSRYSSHEPPSRLIAVPKTLKGPRLIASEPTAHQWCQQIILDFITSRLEFTPISNAIHFRDQRENQEFARRASRDQSHATVDLSSASDRLSTWVVERVFRRNPTLLSALHASRTRWVYNPIDAHSPTYHKLRKFACMGSACTFPIQSIVFTVIAIGCTLYSRGIPITNRSIREIAREVRVFGDDIIVPKDGWVALQGALGHLGLKVNPHKTYATGKFRESCGLDAYDGHDVTPVYSMTYPDVSRPESIISLVATSHNFVMKGYERAMEYIKTRVQATGVKSVANVALGSGLFGWPDVHSVGNSHLKSRWNTLLQRREYRCVRPKSRTRWDLPDSSNLLLQYFTVTQRPYTVLGDRLGIGGRPKTTLGQGWETLV